MSQNSTLGSLPKFVVLVDTHQPLKRWQTLCLERLKGEAECVGLFHQDRTKRLPDWFSWFVPALRTGDSDIPILSAWPTQPLDFILSFDLDLSHWERYCSQARWGVWSFEFGDPPWSLGIAEHALGKACVSSRLVARHAGSSAVRNLYHSTLRTEWNLFLTMQTLLGACADWAPRAIKISGSANSSSKQQRRATTPPKILSALVKDALRRVRKHVMWELFGYDIWNVGLKSHEGALETLSLNEAHYLPFQKAFSFLADPFPLPDGTLLVEQASHAQHGFGRICRLDPSRDEVELEPVIEEKHHLSYPFVFRHQEQTYCIPEAHRSERCSLYKMDHLGRFRFESILLERLCVIDPTLLFHHNRWWLFFCDKSAQSNSRLYAYFSDSLQGEWRPHLLNPLKEDVSSARPAGPFFQRDNKLYRPAQDCSQTYGGAVRIQQVVELTPTSFKECQVLKLSPDSNSPYPHGAHHLVVDKDQIIFDAKRSHIDLLFPIRRWIQKS